MRIETEELVGGGTIDVLVPENADDIAELQRLSDRGELDDRLSFGDPPRRPRRRRRRR